MGMNAPGAPPVAPSPWRTLLERDADEARDELCDDEARAAVQHAQVDAEAAQRVCAALLAVAAAAAVVRRKTTDERAQAGGACAGQA